MKNAFDIRNLYLINNASAQNSGISMYQMAGIANMPEPRLARARRIAAEVRARRPHMQVKKEIT